MRQIEFKGIRIDNGEWAKKQEPFTNTYILAHKSTLEELINHFKK